MHTAILFYHNSGVEKEPVHTFLIHSFDSRVLEASLRRGPAFGGRELIGYNRRADPYSMQRQIPYESRFGS
jgi:hypothetical protein